MKKYKEYNSEKLGGQVRNYVEAEEREKKRVSDKVEDTANHRNTGKRIRDIATVKLKEVLVLPKRCEVNCLAEIKGECEGDTLLMEPCEIGETGVLVV